MHQQGRGMIKAHSSPENLKPLLGELPIPEEDLAFSLFAASASISMCPLHICIALLGSIETVQCVVRGCLQNPYLNTSSLT